MGVLGLAAGIDVGHGFAKLIGVEGRRLALELVTKVDAGLAVRTTPLYVCTLPRSRICLKAADCQQQAAERPASSHSAC